MEISNDSSYEIITTNNNINNNNQINNNINNQNNNKKEIDKIDLLNLLLNPKQDININDYIKRINFAKLSKKEIIKLIYLKKIYNDI